MIRLSDISYFQHLISCRCHFIGRSPMLTDDALSGLYAILTDNAFAVPMALNPTGVRYTNDGCSPSNKTSTNPTSPERV